MKSIKQSSAFKNKGKFRFQLEEFSAPTQKLRQLSTILLKKKNYTETLK
jgi:hypothetical protein